MYPCIQNATLAMGEQIHYLINAYSRIEDTGVLPRSLKDIYENIRDFIVCIENDHVIGCVCLHIFWNDLAEIRSLAVDPSKKTQGIGKKLVEAIEHEAKNLGIPKLFTLTKVPDFFQKLGYKVIQQGSLPKGAAWGECMNCPKYPHCDEIALEKEI